MGYAEDMIANGQEAEIGKSPIHSSPQTIREGYTLMREFPQGEAIVSMIQYQETVLVATSKGVYILMAGRFHPMEFVVLPSATAPD